MLLVYDKFIIQGNTLQSILPVYNFSIKQIDRFLFFATCFLVEIEWISLSKDQATCIGPTHKPNNTLDPTADLPFPKLKSPS